MRNCRARRSLAPSQARDDRGCGQRAARAVHLARVLGDGHRHCGRRVLRGVLARLRSFIPLLERPSVLSGHQGIIERHERASLRLLCVIDFRFILSLSLPVTVFKHCMLTSFDVFVAVSTGARNDELSHGTQRGRADATWQAAVLLVLLHGGGKLTSLTFHSPGELF